MKFDYDRDFSTIDFRAHPELYQIGVGEQGVFRVQPYKGEILPHWRFATPDDARESSRAIFELYQGYKAEADFVGMDMARKFLQMGYTRSRRYANHRGGRKFDKATGAPTVEPGDPAKAESALIFREALDRVKDDPDYLALKARHRDQFDPPTRRDR